MRKGIEGNARLLIVYDRIEFMRVMENIRQSLIYELAYPVIHFEMHGDENGLELTNGELISWDELRFHLLQLNGICQNNLLVTMATCKGGYIFKTIKLDAWTPFWGFVGPFEIVNTEEVMSNYTAFYDEFLRTENLDQAVKALGEGNPGLIPVFRFMNTELVFEQAYRNYEESHLTPQRVEERANELLSILRAKAAFQGYSDEEIIKGLIKSSIVGENPNIRRNLMRRFFLLDVFPDHAQYYEFCLDG